MSEITEEILKRIARRYENCNLNIYPYMPVLTPVEAVLRCAAEEGFKLVQQLPDASVAQAAQPTLHPSLEGLLAEAVYEAVPHLSEIERTMIECEVAHMLKLQYPNLAAQPQEVPAGAPANIKELIHWLTVVSEAMAKGPREEFGRGAISAMEDCIVLLKGLR